MIRELLVQTMGVPTKLRSFLMTVNRLAVIHLGNMFMEVQLSCSFQKISLLNSLVDTRFNLARFCIINIPNAVFLEMFNQAFSSSKTNKITK